MSYSTGFQAGKTYLPFMSAKIFLLVLVCGLLGGGGPSLAAFFHEAEKSLGFHRDPVQKAENPCRKFGQYPSFNPRTSAYEVRCRGRLYRLR